MNYWIIFTISQLLLLSMFTPWATLNEDVVINDNCTIYKGHYFDQWGGACCIGWEEMKTYHTNSYFAMLDSLTTNRVYDLIAIALINIPLFYKLNDKYCTIITLAVLIICLMTTSGYYNGKSILFIIINIM